MGNLDKLGNDDGHQIFTASYPRVDIRSADNINRTLSIIVTNVASGGGDVAYIVTNLALPLASLS